MDGLEGDAGSGEVVEFGGKVAIAGKAGVVTGLGDIDCGLGEVDGEHLAIEASGQRHEQRLIAGANRDVPLHGGPAVARGPSLFHLGHQPAAILRFGEEVIRDVAGLGRKEPILHLHDQLFAELSGREQIGFDRAEIVHALARLEQAPVVDHLYALDIGTSENIGMRLEFTGTGIEVVGWRGPGGKGVADYEQGNGSGNEGGQRFHHNPERKCGAARVAVASRRQCDRPVAFDGFRAPLVSQSLTRLGAGKQRGARRRPGWVQASATMGGAAGALPCPGWSWRLILRNGTRITTRPNETI